MSDQKPRVVKITSATVKTYRITVEGCEIRPAPYSKKTYRPVEITVVKRDGNVSRVDMTGPNIKKDGSDSEVWTRDTLYSSLRHPAWLGPILGGLA